MRLSRAEAAEVHRLGLATGCFTPAQVAAWADRAVASDPAPDPALVALPRLPSAEQADAALRHAAAGAPRERAHRVVLGLLARRLIRDRARAPELRRALAVFRRLSDVLDDADYAGLDEGGSRGLHCEAEGGPAHEALQAAGRLEAFLERHGIPPETFGL